ncbi:hypothetical protein GGR50DRAFT_157066 [Xylaria sp. CBS 124048]|nr:hypothetical protein GGR50DRAFT_157066 [Xylaria sp. CBS 124048]
MPPLILHNVPDEELYTGDDGIQRPYAMIWPDNDRQRPAPRTRSREINESGSFGKSTRRSRSRIGSAPPKREDATMQSADKVFSSYLAKQQVENATDPAQRKLRQDESKSGNPTSASHKEPVEIILRGYASPSQQYAAINHYEQLAGRICEDYSREPPIEARRYKSDLRDPALTRRQPLTRAEREKVNRIASGQHWIKVTFESQEAASAALFASPQKILGHLVYAEQYRSMPPMENAAIVDVRDTIVFDDDHQSNSSPDLPKPPSRHRNGAIHAPSGPFRLRMGRGSPPESQASTQTLDTATVSVSSSTTMSTATVTGVEVKSNENKPEPELNTAPVTERVGGRRRIHTAKKAVLLPADAALKKGPTLTESLLAFIPLLGWFSGAMIGNEVPRNEVGEFDMNRASLYWKIMYWLDYWFRLFGHELVSGDKED